QAQKTAESKSDKSETVPEEKKRTFLKAHSGHREAFHQLIMKNKQPTKEEKPKIQATSEIKKAPSPVIAPQKPSEIQKDDTEQPRDSKQKEIEHKASVPVREEKSSQLNKEESKTEPKDEPKEKT